MKKPVAWSVGCRIQNHRLHITTRSDLRGQGVCEGAGSERVRPAPASLSIITGFLLLFPVLMGMLTGGPPRFHAVGPNPTDVDQFNFIVLLLSLLQVFNTMGAEDSLPPDNITFMSALCIISVFRLTNDPAKTGTGCPEAISGNQREKQSIIGQNATSYTWLEECEF